MRISVLRNVPSPVLLAWAILIPFGTTYGLQELGADSSAVTGQEEQTEGEGERDGDSEKARESNQDSEFFKKIQRRMGGSHRVSRVSPGIMQLLEPLAAQYSASNVRIWSNGDQIALGIIVDSSGKILTVAGDLASPLECQLSDGRRFPAVVAGVHKETGLALLEIATSDLTPFTLADQGKVSLGSWLVSLSPDNQPVGLGVVGVEERPIAAGSAFIGIGMRDLPDSTGVIIISVSPQSPAALAKLQEDDILVQVDSYPVTDRTALVKILRENFEPGDRVELTIKRGSDELKIGLELANKEKFTPEDQRSAEQDRMGSRLSSRRSGFPQAIQHDSHLNANQMGSPVVDLNGHIAGINIARSGRVSTLALPMSVVLPALEELKTGFYAPGLINSERILSIATELREVEKELEPLNTKLSDYEIKLAEQKARREELQRLEDDLRKRMGEFEAETASLEEEVKSLRAQVTELTLRARSLEKEKQALEVGSRD